VGLAIARRVVEAHGGRLWIELMPGDRSTFWVALPIAPSDAKAIHAAPQSSLALNAPGVV
jgi:signal transduction histidine kinase